jgi:hypothetical protein
MRPLGVFLLGNLLLWPSPMPGNAQAQSDAPSQPGTPSPAGQQAQPSPPAAQPPAQPPAAQLSPQAAFDQSTRALEIIRRSPQNWSDVELAALKAAREQARIACIARNPDQLAGADLLALAHLCAFAQQWAVVGQAAGVYIGSVMPPASDLQAAAKQDPRVFRDLSTAFDYRIQSALNTEDPDVAFMAAKTMLRTVPYDEFVSEATGSTARYLHFIRPDDALELLRQRQPLVLDRIKASSPPAPSVPVSSVPVSSVPVSAASVPLPRLYADALALAALEQFTNHAQDAAAVVAELEAALPATLSSESAMLIAEQRRQYQLLGARLPTLDVMGSLATPGAPPPDGINTRFTAATVFLLFPDWCNQCIAMAFNSTKKAKDLLDLYHARLYPLMAQAAAPDKPATAALKDVPLPKTAHGAAASAHLHVDQQLLVTSTPDARLAGTPTLVVTQDTLTSLAATDVPLLIAIDHTGVIRWLETAPDDVLAAGGDIDQIVQHILAVWPPA